MSDLITVFISRVAANMETRKQQSKMLDVLSNYKIADEKINLEVVDVSSNKDDLTKMREIVGDPHALAPQIAKGNKYCGSYDAFEEAVENKTLKEFLNL
ncbi:hypothetical protein BsWGS_26099 [Bradybaena similaris]